MVNTKAQHPRIFFDGQCGFCHSSVRFIAFRDHEKRFRFAPIGGETFQRLIPEPQRTDLPDSVLVLTTDGRLLARSTGTVYMLRRLGPPWRWFGSLLGLVPAVLRDAAYDLIARNRQRLAAAPSTACPIMPPEQRALFEP